MLDFLKKLWYPKTFLLWLLIPVSVVWLVLSMVFFGSNSPFSIAAYILSAYTLTAVCLRIPDAVAFCKRMGQTNRLVLQWRQDTRFRVNVSLYTALLFNAVYAALQLGLGIYHRSFWFISIYYVLLALMRFFSVRYLGKHRVGTNIGSELVYYRACGWIFLVMNLALSLMIFFMVYWNRTFHHHEITAIAMAAYTFTAFTMAIVNLIKYRRFQSPVYTATKTITLAAASVSMLTLTSTLLTAFGDPEKDPLLNRILLAACGGSVSLLILVLALYMIVQGSKQLTLLRNEETTNGNS